MKKDDTPDIIMIELPLYKKEMKVWRIDYFRNKKAVSTGLVVKDVDIAKDIIIDTKMNFNDYQQNTNKCYLR